MRPISSVTAPAFHQPSISILSPSTGPFAGLALVPHSDPLRQPRHPRHLLVTNKHPRRGSWLPRSWLISSHLLGSSSATLRIYSSLLPPEPLPASASGKVVVVRSLAFPARSLPYLFCSVLFLLLSFTLQ